MCGMAEQTTEQTSVQEIRECYGLLLKTARRCVRDLRHAVDNIQDRNIAEIFKDRVTHYETVLGGVSDYRIELVQRIQWLESLLSKDGETPF